ncbi:MAG: SMC-Scp complex subunit ScpB [Thermoproteota archaeon]
MGNDNELIVHSEEMRRIEALLFAAGRPLDLDKIKAYSRLKTEDVQLIMERLSESYRKIGSSIEILKLPSGQFVMQVKAEYAKYAAAVASGFPLSLGARKTLALIAYKQPIPQSTLIKMRGSHSYKYVKELIKTGYVKGEKLGRTKLLKTAPITNELFGAVDGEHLKSMLANMLRERGVSKDGS